MLLYRITTCAYINDLSGEGSFMNGGRWNSKGTRLLYTAESMALAMLEALAHITMINQQRPYCRIQLQAGNWQDVLSQNWCTEVDANQLPINWRLSPEPDSLKLIGDEFVKASNYLALKVPSVLVPDSYNYLLNPRHQLFAHVKVLQSEQISFDQRLV